MWWRWWSNHPPPPSPAADYLSGCVGDARWSPSLYPDLYTPTSPSWSLHWTYRDYQLVNLPVSLLVEGDVIALRPGQEAFAPLRGIKVRLWWVTWHWNHQDFLRLKRCQCNSCTKCCSNVDLRQIQWRGNCCCLSATCVGCWLLS